MLKFPKLFLEPQWILKSTNFQIHRLDTPDPLNVARSVLQLHSESVLRAGETMHLWSSLWSDLVRKICGSPFTDACKYYGTVSTMIGSCPEHILHATAAATVERTHLHLSCPVLAGDRKCCPFLMLQWLLLLTPLARMPPVTYQTKLRGAPGARKKDAVAFPFYIIQ